MNYSRVYNNLIKRSKNRSVCGYTEKHHIIPVCMGGSNNKNNIVKLTAREHFIAHILLVKIHKNKHSLIKAVNMMCLFSDTHKKHRSKNRLYGWLKERFSVEMSMSQLGKLNSQHSTRWIHNKELQISKKIKKHLDLPIDWLEGRVMNFNKSEKCNTNCVVCGVCTNKLHSNYCDVHRSINRTTNSILHKHKPAFIEMYNAGEFKNYSSTLKHFGAHPNNSSLNRVLEGWIEEIKTENIHQ